MTNLTQKLRSTHRLLATAAVLTCFAAGAAFAGGCPTDKMVAEGKGQAMSSQPAAGVTDDVIATNDLAKQPVNINDRLFRLRRLVIQPGGVVPWHSHGDRPAIIYIVSGEIIEYASTCAVPIVHKAGEATAEKSPTQHWWKNTGSVPVELLSADLFHKQKTDEHMM
ncbi:MAG TPA: cupin domain-containing protein [Tepidisphaeraceae bacterium]|nr:cupin domain-containing protein [Tepidisphaeraceae bacterium]